MAPEEAFRFFGARKSRILRMSFFFLMRYWLFKSEPNCFSYDDLLTRPNQTEPWDGVRNYQARNFMRDEMQVGDKGIFYHSNCKPPHAAGTVEIVRAGYPDHTAWDPDSDHPDAKSTPEHPRWYMVDVQAGEKFKHPISLAEMKQYTGLCDIKLLARGNRLSVMPISREHFFFLCDLGKTL